MYERAVLSLEDAQGAIDAMIKQVKSNKERYWQHGVFAVSNRKDWHCLVFASHCPFDSDRYQYLPLHSPHGNIGNRLHCAGRH